MVLEEGQLVVKFERVEGYRLLAREKVTRHGF